MKLTKTCETGFASIESSLYSFKQLFHAQVTFQQTIHVRYLAQGNNGFAKADVGNTHPVKVEIQSGAIINCATTLYS